MKKIILFAIAAQLFLQCTSVKTHNKNVDRLQPEAALKNDVDYAYKKLKKLHPNLYWYISKQALDHKFDSLKATITRPMTSFAFFKKISPVIASVRQGHMSVIPSVKMLTKSESKALVAKGTGPFSQFEFELINDRLYVTKNKSYDKSIRPGYEVTAINNTPSDSLLKSYNSWFTSDGYNQTFKKAKLGKVIPAFFTNENGIRDSIVYNFRYHDSIKVVSIKRRVVDTTKTQKPASAKKKRLTAAEKAKIKADRQKRDLNGYNATTGLNNRELHFIESDSSIAVLKIRGFSIGDPYGFYKKAFTKIRDYHSKTLVLDLRDNPGGSLMEIADLYGYLSDTTYVFSDKSEVASKTSLLNADYFSGGSIGVKAIKAIFSPLYLGYTFFKVHRYEDGKFYYATRDTRPQKIHPEAFKGKIYVLINGGSFSASCILSSNLKGSGRAFFVGQETGGAYNGTVAGRMPLITLPHSKIQVRVGLMFIAPHYKTDVPGRGIFPDREIIPSLQDRVDGTDPEMNWVLEDIKKNPVISQTD